METHNIRELANIMRETGLTSLEYTDGGHTVKMSRDGSIGHSAAHSSANTGGAPADAEPGLSAHTVSSPMVGVFYSAPGSDLAPYVSQGDTVSAGDILCIIEAMKMMNEITAEVSGVISEVCVSNKQVVEFGTPLFIIEKS